MIEADLNQFMMELLGSVGVITYTRPHQQLKSFEVKSFVYKICGLCHSHQFISILL